MLITARDIVCGIRHRSRESAPNLAAISAAVPVMSGSCARSAACCASSATARWQPGQRTWCARPRRHASRAINECSRCCAILIAPRVEGADIGEVDAVGLAGRKPNVEIRHSFVVSRSRDEVRSFFADFARVVHCIPGASFTKPPTDENIEGKMSRRADRLWQILSGARA